MKLEDQVCSLELAKRLKELGVKQESLFFHQRMCAIEDNKEYWALMYVAHGTDSVSAFTVAELGEILGVHLFKTQIMNDQFMSPSEDGNCWDTTKNEAESRAKLIIFLIKKGILKP